MLRLCCSVCFALSALSLSLSWGFETIWFLECIDCNKISTNDDNCHAILLLQIMRQMNSELFSGKRRIVVKNRHRCVDVVSTGTVKIHSQQRFLELKVWSEQITNERYYTQLNARFVSLDIAFELTTQHIHTERGPPRLDWSTPENARAYASWKRLYQELTSWCNESRLHNLLNPLEHHADSECCFAHSVNIYTAGILVEQEHKIIILSCSVSTLYTLI